MSLTTIKNKQSQVIKYKPPTAMLCHMDFHTEQEM